MSLLNFKKLKSLFKKEKKIEKTIEKNLSVFIKKEEKEALKLAKGQESFTKYCKDSSSIFEDYFIPSEKNNHKPRILRPRQLFVMAVILILLKLTVTGYLFLVYEEEAKMAENISGRILELINQDRLTDGQGALNLNTVLSASATLKAKNMADENYFAHTSPDGRHPWDFINRKDYPYAFVGENLAMNFVNADDVHQALMASPSHRKNILNERYLDVGLAIVDGEINGKKTKILVEIFGIKTETALVKVSPKETSDKKNVVVASSLPEEKINAKTETAREIEPVKILGTEKIPTTTADKNIKTEDTTKKLAIEPVKPKEQTKKIASVKPVPSNTINPEITTEKTAPLIPIAKNPVESPTQTGSSTEIKTDFEKNDMALASSAKPELIAQANTKIIEPVLPDPNDLNKQIIQINRTENKKLTQAFVLMDILKIVYVAFLIFLIMSLLLNIFIRVSVQHKSVLIQSALLIVLAVILVTYNFDFIKNVKNVAENIVLL